MFTVRLQTALTIARLGGKLAAEKVLRRESKVLRFRLALRSAHSMRASQPNQLFDRTITLAAGSETPMSNLSTIELDAMALLEFLQSAECKLLEPRPQKLRMSALLRLLEVGSGLIACLALLRELNAHAAGETFSSLAALTAAVQKRAASLRGEIAIELSLPL